MAEARGYSLDLYCDDPNHAEKAPWTPTSCHGEYFAENYTSAKKLAKDDGWKYVYGKQICRWCKP